MTLCFSLMETKDIKNYIKCVYRTSYCTLFILLWRIKMHKIIHFPGICTHPSFPFSLFAPPTVAAIKAPQEPIISSFECQKLHLPEASSRGTAHLQIHNSVSTYMTGIHGLLSPTTIGADNNEVRGRWQGGVEWPPFLEIFHLPYSCLHYISVWSGHLSSCL